MCRNALLQMKPVNAEKKPVDMQLTQRLHGVRAEEGHISQLVCHLRVCLVIPKRTVLQANYGMVATLVRIALRFLFIKVYT